jgi:hypothetical protein
MLVIDRDHLLLEIVTFDLAHLSHDAHLQPVHEAAATRIARALALQRGETIVSAAIRIGDRVLHPKIPSTRQV